MKYKRILLKLSGEALMGDDLRYIHSSAVQENKTEYLDKLTSGHYFYHGLEVQQREFRVLGEVAGSDGLVAATGGELAAAVLVDAMVRTLPGALGDADSAEQDSFKNGLLDFPHYTRPEVFEGQAVPEVLVGGNHATIARWRLQQALLLASLRLALPLASWLQALPLAS